MRNSAVIGKTGFLLLTAVPLLAGGIYAVGYSFGAFGLLSEGLTLEHWQSLLTDDRFYLSLIFSTWISLAAIVIAVASALTLVVGMKAFRINAGERMLYFPLAFPAIVSAFVAYQLLSGSGFFSRISNALGWTASIEAFPEMVHDQYGIGIILMHAAMAFPVFSLYFLNIWKKDRLDQLAELTMSMGGSRVDEIRRVIAPILLRRSRPLILLYGIFVAGAYEAPLILGSQQPQMITLYIVQRINRFDLAERPVGYAATILVMALILALLFTGNRRLQAKL